MAERLFVMLSGGIKSAVLLHLAIAAKRDRHYDADICAVIVDGALLPQVAKHCAVDYASLHSIKYTVAQVDGNPGMLPARLLMEAATYADRWVVHNRRDGFLPPKAHVYFGGNDDFNMPYFHEFLGAMANAIQQASERCVRLQAPLQWTRLSEIVRLGQSFGVAWNATYSCVQGGQKHCGVCVPCRHRKRAFERAGIVDPTEYEPPRN